MDSYFTIERISEGLYKEKSSRFISFIIPVKNKDEIESYIKRIRAKYHDARHVCFAYRLGLDDVYCFRTYDDGEPSGTAGKPILSVLISAKLDNVLAIVVRFFGGVKLGTSGLINAYHRAVFDALDNNIVVKKIIEINHSVCFSYEHTGKVMRILKKFNVYVLYRDLNVNCKLTFSVAKSNEMQLLLCLNEINGIEIK